MNEPFSSDRAGEPAMRPRSRWPWWVAAGFVAVAGLVLLIPRATRTPGGRAGDANTAVETKDRDWAGGGRRPGSSPTRPAGANATAEEVVAGKVSQFARDRLRITRAMAKKFGVALPEEVNRFFAAVEGGQWDELNSEFQALKRLRDGGETRLGEVWGPILETLLIAECAHNWPAQELLDYGKATLGSLRPGMVFVGGTDPGRGIPTLLSETADGEHPVVLTQNALADGSYLQYIRFLYGDQMALLTSDDSQRAFSEYLADAQKRLEHDRQFPDEPAQLRPGEDVRVSDNRVQVSGQVAVMAINERLLAMLMDKNPDLGFALEESFPLRSTYGAAVPLGPIMELRSSDSQNALTPERAAQVADYWAQLSQQMSSDPAAPAGSDPRKAWAKMADAQANLLADRGFVAEAERTYRLAMQLEPSSPETVYGLGQLLAQAGRVDEARQLVAQFGRDHPGQGPRPGWGLTFPAPH